MYIHTHSYTRISKENIAHFCIMAAYQYVIQVCRKELESTLPDSEDRQTPSSFIADSSIA
jgi:hypothetical protein